MIDGRYQGVWLNDVALASVHPSILVQHINEGALEYNMATATRPIHGLFVTHNIPQTREIIVEFAIREHQNYALRAEAYQAVCAWAAKGGWLELSDHSGQQIYVTCTQMPSLGRLREWNESMTITFTAAQYPFWMSKYSSMKKLDAVTSGTVNLSVMGTRETCLECDITPTGANLTSITLSANGTEMTIDLTASPVAANTKLQLYYDDFHYLHLDAGGTGLLRYRSGSDDILLEPGMINEVEYTFNTACNAVFKSRGVWT